MADNNPKQLKSSAGQQPEESAAKILIIEDDPIFLSVLEGFLTQKNYQVITAETGEQGLIQFESEQPDVVLCDLMLPQMSGLGVLNTLLKTLSQVPVIVISGSTDLADIREAVKLGASDYFVKPIENLEDLQTSIENCLSQTMLLDDFEQAEWEFDAHLQALYEDDQLYKRISNELVPHYPLRFKNFSVTYQSDLSHEPAKDMLVFHLVDAPLGTLKDFTNQEYLEEHKGALVFLAATELVAPQQLTSLLILKSVLNKFLRESIGWAGGIVTKPGELLEALNEEICQLNMHCAFEVVALWIDAKTQRLIFCQAGELIESNPPLNLRSHLALGTWQNASYQAQELLAAPVYSFKTQHGQLQVKMLRPKQAELQPGDMNMLH